MVQISWTTPKTWAVGDVLTAADMNTYNRDNLTALQPQAATVSTSPSTASTSYTDLGTVGPAVTLTTGSSVLVDIGCGLANGTGGDGAFMSYAVSGATTISAVDATSVGATSASAGASVQAAFSYLQTGLTPGSNTFTAKYKAVTGGTATFTQRIIIVTACF